MFINNKENNKNMKKTLEQLKKELKQLKEQGYLKSKDGMYNPLILIIGVWIIPVKYIQIKSLEQKIKRIEQN